jgi:hypothetical protein
LFKTDSYWERFIMALLVFIDESGNSELVEDPRNPVFSLCAVVCQSTTYDNTIVPLVNNFKETHCPSKKGSCLHSYDIRNYREEFKFLKERTNWDKFDPALRDMLSTSPYHVLATAIKISDHMRRYGCYAHDPYHLSLEFILEKILRVASDLGEREIIVKAEWRGKKKDTRLKDAYYDIIRNGTRWKPRGRFTEREFSNLELITKGQNIIGIQLADLMAYPIAKHYGSSTPYRAFEVVRPKIYHPAYMDKYTHPQGWIYGLKTFPT